MPTSSRREQIKADIVGRFPALKGRIRIRLHPIGDTITVLKTDRKRLITFHYEQWDARKEATLRELGEAIERWDSPAKL